MHLRVFVCQLFRFVLSAFFRCPIFYFIREFIYYTITRFTAKLPGDSAVFLAHLILHKAFHLLYGDERHRHAENDDRQCDEGVQKASVIERAGRVGRCEHADGLFGELQTR